MKHRLKFSGKFKNLKKVGYSFHKLYASNYKAYNKAIGKSGFKIWVWVAHGGYIEINDFYDNTKNFLEAIQTINWEEVKAKPSGNKYLYVRFNHNDPSKGYYISNNSFTLDTFLLCEKNKMTMEEAHDFLKKDFDREKVIYEDTCKEIIKEINHINNLVV